MADDDMNVEEEGGLMDRIKESPRTVSALIIILIVAAAIYAFSGEESSSPEEIDEAGVVVSEELAPGTTDGAADEATTDEAAGEVVVEEIEPVVELPEPTQTEQAFVEVAQPGDGLTHLARRAAGRWLSQNQAGYLVTNEHRIYIEDYIKDQMKRHPVSLGQEVAVPFDLIAEAVAAASELNDGQLENLKKYSSKVFTS